MTRRDLIVADAGPLIALASIGQVALLSSLYARVVVPERVFLELERGKPRPGWDLTSRFAWLERVADPDPVPSVAALGLDPGESAAMGWAMAHPGAWLLLDDLAARRAARQLLGLEVTGTVGVLIEARRAGLAPPLRPLLEALRDRGLHLSPGLMAEALLLSGDA